MFAVFRNESLRLPYFIKYYKKLGVDRFFLIDNNSNDDSLTFLRNIDDVHLFKTIDTFKNFWYWIQYLLEKYGKNHWCLVVDIDELFTYPNVNLISLKDLTIYLEANNFQAIRSFLLYMYSNVPIDEISYNSNENPLEVVPYFDKEYRTLDFGFTNKKSFENFKFEVFTGGMRTRVFGEISPPHLLSKIALFHNISGIYLTDGMHAIDGANVSDIQGVVFHTKFLQDFPEEVNEEVKRKVHFGNAFYYRHYKKLIKNVRKLNFYHRKSEKYINNQQLIELALLKTSEQFEKYCQNIQKENT